MAGLCSSLKNAYTGCVIEQSQQGFLIVTTFMWMTLTSNHWAWAKVYILEDTYH